MPSAQGLIADVTIADQINKGCYKPLVNKVLSQPGPYDTLINYQQSCFAPYIDRHYALQLIAMIL